MQDCAADGNSAGADPFPIQVVQPGQGGGVLLIAAAEPTREEGETFPVDPPDARPAAHFDGPDAHGAPERVEGEIPPCPSEGDSFRAASLPGVAGVRLRPLGPVSFFLTRGQAYTRGDKVMVDMEGAMALGEVVNLSRADPARLTTEDAGKLRPIIRKAGEQELAAAADIAGLTEEAVRFCKSCIRERDLEMKLVDVLVMHDRSKMIFYFTAPARIDFRELVKDLVRKYRTRIELRQIGVRHETQMAGAIGNCGMVCCCRRYLRKFAPVAIKMAKEQNVFLNPVKISGICGRLLCCLAYEQDHYDEFYRRCPKLGKKYQTDKGSVRVLRASLFRESVSVLNENNEEAEYTLEEWKTLHPYRPDGSQPQSQNAQNAQGGGARKEEGRRTRDRDGGRGEVRKREDDPGPFAAPASSLSAAGLTDAGPADGVPDDEDDTESIFGLAPRKTAQPSGEDGAASGGGLGNGPDSRPRASGPDGNRRHRRR